MEEYNPKDVNLILGGVVLTGYAEDSFITAERMEDSFTEYIGAKGEVSTSENANKTGEVTVTLASTSPSVSYLNELALKQGEQAVVSMQIVDLNNDTTKISGNEARVRKPASMEYGKEVGEREFVIFVADMDIR